jgi:hypothetical protein
MEKNKIGQLSNWMLNQKEGRELIAELKRIHTDDQVYPKAPEILAQFGGGSEYAAFRAGQLSYIRFIELHAKGFKDQENVLKANAEKAQATKESK